MGHFLTIYIECRSLSLNWIPERLILALTYRRSYCGLQLVEFVVGLYVQGQPVTETTSWYLLPGSILRRTRGPVRPALFTRSTGLKAYYVTSSHRRRYAYNLIFYVSKQSYLFIDCSVPLFHQQTFFYEVLGILACPRTIKIDCDYSTKIKM